MGVIYTIYSLEYSVMNTESPIIQRGVVMVLFLKQSTIKWRIASILGQKFSASSSQQSRNVGMLQGCISRPEVHQSSSRLGRLIIGSHIGWIPSCKGRVPAQDGLFALILSYVAKTLYLLQEQDQFSIKSLNLFFDLIDLIVRAFIVRYRKYI